MNNKINKGGFWEIPKNKYICHTHLLLEIKALKLEIQ